MIIDDDDEWMKIGQMYVCVCVGGCVEEAGVGCHLVYTYTQRKKKIYIYDTIDKMKHHNHHK